MITLSRALNNAGRVLLVFSSSCTVPLLFEHTDTLLVSRASVSVGAARRRASVKVLFSLIFVSNVTYIRQNAMLHGSLNAWGYSGVKLRRKTLTRSSGLIMSASHWKEQSAVSSVLCDTARSDGKFKGDPDTIHYHKEQVHLFYHCAYYLTDLQVSPGGASHTLLLCFSRPHSSWAETGACHRNPVSEEYGGLGWAFGGSRKHSGLVVMWSIAFTKG